MKPGNYKLTIAYDGTEYAGWQLQPNGTSVQQVIEAALAKIIGTPVRIHGSGRTDAACTPARRWRMRLSAHVIHPPRFASH